MPKHLNPGAPAGRSRGEVPRPRRIRIPARAPGGTNRDRAGRSATAGFSVLEVLVASTVLVLALMGLLGALVSSDVLIATNQELSLAMEAARQQVETMNGRPLGEIVRSYNLSPEDDPGGAGSAPGAYFSVPGLIVDPYAPGGAHGEVRFPGSGPGSQVVDETVPNPSWGTPRDLNGDGSATGTAVLPDFVILLPVTVRVRWLGRSGHASVEIHALLR